MFVSYVALMIGAAVPHPGWAQNHITLYPGWWCDDGASSWIVPNHMELEDCSAFSAHCQLSFIKRPSLLPFTFIFLASYFSIQCWDIFENWQNVDWICQNRDSREQCSANITSKNTVTVELWRFSIHFIWSNLQPLRPHSRGSAFDELFANSCLV